MSFVPLIVVGALAVGLAIVAIILALQNSKLKVLNDDESGRARELRQQVETVRMQHLEAQRQFQVAEVERQSALAAHEEERRRALAAMEDAQLALARDQQEKEEYLDHQEKEIEWLRQELERRPKISRKTYKILTLGVSGTGKTALTLKWSNPLTDLGTLQGTKIERYERTVSHVAGKDATIEHVFEVGDWGGEHVVDAQQELIVDEIHGLLIVVDLAARDAKAVDPGRVQQQLREFQPEALKFFFGPKTIASCKAVVLFINKSDVLSGTPAEVEKEAKRYYQRLIDDLDKYKSQLDVRVLVGSATYGHSTHHLFAHFVERILPRNAYDNQLLQRMKADSPAEPPTQPLPPGARRPAGLPPAPAPVSGGQASGSSMIGAPINGRPPLPPPQVQSHLPLPQQPPPAPQMHYGMQPPPPSPPRAQSSAMNEPVLPHGVSGKIPNGR